MLPSLRPLAKCAPTRMAGSWEQERRRFVTLRQALGWSQIRCAQELGVSPRTLARWETTGPSMTPLPAWAARTLREMAGAPSSRRTGT